MALPVGGGVQGCADQSADVRSPQRTFVRSQDRGQSIVWAVGDGADGGATAKAVARLIARGRPDRVLYLGDVYDDGSPADFRRHFTPVYGKLAPIMAPTPGNHEWPRHREGYDRYWARVLRRPVPAFYAFRVGGWQLLSLNSEAPHGPRSAQLRWLRRRLRGPGNCRLAFWHRPRYSAGTSHGDQPDVQPLWDALRGRARLVLNGHEHNMQRFGPVDDITQLVSGAGGHGLYPLRRPSPRVAFGDDDHYGALRLRLRRGRAAYAFIAADGRTLDAGAVACRPH
ncbi:MAG: metallophosphoesterase family protein [Solirubrobacteraceae bacterium]